MVAGVAVVLVAVTDAVVCDVLLAVVFTRKLLSSGVTSATASVAAAAAVALVAVVVVVLVLITLV